VRRIIATMAKRRRRGYGENSIYQRASDGRWVAVVSLGLAADGKRIRRVFYADSEAAAKRKLQDQTAREGGRLRKQPDSGTIGAFMTEWLKEVDHSAAPTTAANYKTVWTKHAEPLIGRKRLATFAPNDVSELYRRLREKGVAPATIAKIRVVLHRAFEVARERGSFFGDNPFGQVKPPRYSAKERKTLTLEQAQHLVAACQKSKDRFEAAVVLAVACGLRIGELLGLKWSDIDFARKTLAVQRSLQEVSGRFTISEGKTKTARRKINLGSVAIAALRRRQAIAESDEWVFTTTAGTHPNRTAFRQRHLSELLKTAKCPAVPPHALRHSFATMLLEQGVPTKVASEALGHANPAITQRLYQHVIGDLQRRAIDVLDSALSAKIKAGKRA
jgi:integrase